jgi:hypothetical protein
MDQVPTKRAQGDGPEPDFPDFAWLHPDTPPRTTLTGGAISVGGLCCFGHSHAHGNFTARRCVLSPG